MGDFRALTFIEDEIWSLDLSPNSPWKQAPGNTSEFHLAIRGFNAHWDPEGGFQSEMLSKIGPHGQH